MTEKGAVNTATKEPIMRIFTPLKLNKNGQSVAEYTVVFVAIVAVVLVAVPLFLKPGVNKYYASSGGLVEGAATGLDTLAAEIPDKFSKTWSDHTIYSSTNLPYTPPSYAEATTGWAEMQARIGQTVYTGGGGGGAGGGYSGCGGEGQPACP